MTTLTAAALALSLALTMPGVGSLRGSRAAEREGRAEAKADIAAGQLILRMYGINPTGESAYTRLLEARLGVKVQVVGNCTVNGGIIAETAAYNEVMKKEIRKRFGPHALEDIERDAKSASQ